MFHLFLSNNANYNKIYENFEIVLNKMSGQMLIKSQYRQQCKNGNSSTMLAHTNHKPLLKPNNCVERMEIYSD